MTDQKHIEQLESWLRTHVVSGAKCGNCYDTFSAARPAKSIASIPNGAGFSIYVLCHRCACQLKHQGLKGIPNAMKDAHLASLLYFMPPKGRA